MPEHDAIQSADCHEPKHITIGGTADTGKVITNSSTVANVSEYRKLSESDLSALTDVYCVYMDDISNAQSVFVVSEYAGDVVSVRSVIQNAITTNNATITTKIGGVNITGGGLTIAFAGSAAGDVDSATPTATNTVTAGQAIEIATDGLSVTACSAWFTIAVKRS